MTDEPRIIGAEPVGVTSDVTTEAVQTLQRGLDERFSSGQIKVLRFIPSTRTVIDDGSFQVVANTVIEVARGGDRPRPETLDSVITVDGTGQNQTLQSVMIPYLRWSSTAHSK